MSFFDLSERQLNNLEDALKGRVELLAGAVKNWSDSSDLGEYARDLEATGVLLDYCTAARRSLEERRRK